MNKIEFLELGEGSDDHVVVTGARTGTAGKGAGKAKAGAKGKKGGAKKAPKKKAAAKKKAGAKTPKKRGGK
jgi:hypothetical protein